MASPLHVARSRTFPVTAEDAFTATLPLPLEVLFDRRFGPIPPITGTDQDQPGEWGSTGEVRTIRMADGGTMRERLVEVDEPSSFSYEITDVTGPMKPLAGRIEGTWAFDPVGTGCRITWSWTIHPATAIGGLILPIFGLVWKAYAKRALDHLEDLLLAG